VPQLPRIRRDHAMNPDAETEVNARR
jgi:hypothetical protein